MRDNLRGLLEQALKETGLTAPMSRRLPKQIWEAVVGKELAARAQPTVLAGGVLHVLVQDHRWRDQLDAMRTELMARLNARLGKRAIRELRFGLAHEGALPERARSRGPHGLERTRESALARDGSGLATIAPEEPEHLRCAAKLGPELREAFLRAGMAAHRATQEAFA